MASQQNTEITIYEIISRSDLSKRLYIRDFSIDSVDCGSGMDYVYDFYSGDMETVIYCENISNQDG